MDELEMYGSFGMGTSLNRMVMEVDAKNLNLSEENQHMMDALNTINCMDAGMPYGDWGAVRRCNELASILYKKLENNEE